MKFLIKIILGLLVFSTLIFSQDYNKYNIFYRTFEAQYYQNIDSTRYTESTIIIYKPEFNNYKWTYYSKTMQKKPGMFGGNVWKKIENKWAGGQWKPVDDLTIHLRCDSIRVTSETWKLENEIIYKRYPPDSNNERYNDFWMKFEVDGFVIHRYCYTCREFHKLYVYNYSNKKRL